MARKPKIDESVERDLANLDDFNAALRQVMRAPADKRPRSENREPTKAELEQRYKLTRRK